MSNAKIYHSTGSPLTLKQEKFTQEYAKTLNGTQSILKVYNTKDYDTARAMGSEVLANPNVKQRLAQLLEQGKMDLRTYLNKLHLKSEAKKEIVVGQELVKVDDNPIQLKAIEDVLQLHGVLGKDNSSSTNIQNNIVAMGDDNIMEKIAGLLIGTNKILNTTPSSQEHDD